MVNCTPADTSLVSYLWQFGDGQSSIKKEPVNTYSGNGTYWISLSVKNASGCLQTDSNEVTINFTGTASGSLDSRNVNIFPNPAQDAIYIYAGNEIIKSVSLLDITGRDIVIYSNVNATKAKVNSATLPQGMYFIKLNLNNGSYISKVIKE